MNEKLHSIDQPKPTRTISVETNMGQNFTGGCACGSIRYVATSDPTVMMNCHCRDCQRAGGRAYAPVIMLETKAIKLSGEPRYYKTVGRAGKNVERGFCVIC